MRYLVFFSTFFLIFFSCKPNELNYINYYKKVNEIDSIYRLANKPKKAVKKYKRLFHKYEPKNQRYTKEFGTYLLLADRYNIDFGGERQVRKLIRLLAPSSQFDHWNNDYQVLFIKYNLDSLVLKNEIEQWKSVLNQELIDSVLIAIKRDLEPKQGYYNKSLAYVNDLKNIKLLKWIFQHYGFPSQNKIGFEKELDLNNFFLNFGCSNIIDNNNNFEYLEKTLLNYVKSGDCPPNYYAQLIDCYFWEKSKRIPYATNIRLIDETVDTVWVDKNRKLIGLPSLHYQNILVNDYIKNLKKHDYDIDNKQ